MKKGYFILAVIILIGGALFLACNENREKDVQEAREDAQQANNDLKDAQSEYEKEWLQFKRDAEIKILANDKLIAEYKIEIKTASNKFRLKYEKEVAVLEQKNIELRKKISEYKYEGKDKWEEFKQSVNEDMDIIGTALNDIFEKKD